MTGLFAVLLGAWATLAPVGRAPDETVHADLVFQQATGAGYPSYDGRHTSKGMISLFIAYAPGLQGRWLTPESAPPRPRKTFAEWGGARPSPYLNQIPQHPPAYYMLSGTALRAERLLAPVGEAPVEQQWLFLRWFNCLMLLPLPLLAWMAARRLGASDTVALAAAVVPLCVPQLLHIGASINNDNLLVLLSSVVAVLLAGVVQGDARTSRAIVIGLVAGVALLTKALALTLLPWIGLAYLFAAWRARSRWREHAIALLVAGSTAGLLSGWWYLSNLVRYGSLSPSALDPALATSPAGFQPDPLWYIGHFTTNIVLRFWGDFGYFEAPMTPAVVVAATAVIVVSFVAAFVRPSSTRRDRASTSVPRGALAVFASLLLLLLIFVVLNAYRLYSSSGRPAFIQGRYLFAAMVPFAVLTAVGFTRLVGRWSPLVLLGGVVIMQIDAVRVALRGWWAEPTASVSRSLDAWLAWSPLPRVGSYVLIAACLGALAVAARFLWADARGDGTPAHS